MYGDDDEIQKITDEIREILGVRDNDHVKTDGMYQANENEMILL
jgi:hypothetical protein